MNDFNNTSQTKRLAQLGIFTAILDRKSVV